MQTSRSHHGENISILWIQLENHVVCFYINYQHISVFLSALYESDCVYLWGSVALCCSVRVCLWRQLMSTGEWDLTWLLTVSGVLVWDRSTDKLRAETYFALWYAWNLWYFLWAQENKARLLRLWAHVQTIQTSLRQIVSYWKPV